MRVRDVMTQHPVYCHPGDSVQSAAKILCERDIGSLPVVSDADSLRLVGIITDRDLCCGIVAKGLDPTSARVEAVMKRNPVSCRAEQSLDSCERLMQLHQVRRLPVIDQKSRCVGMVSQADVARSEQADKVHRTVAEISRPARTIILASTVIYGTTREDVMADPKKDSERTDQGASTGAAADQELERFADQAARKGLESEQRFDAEHGIVSK
jgi:CBS domain-containing protein